MCRKPKSLHRKSLVCLRGFRLAFLRKKRVAILISSLSVRSTLSETRYPLSFPLETSRCTLVARHFVTKSRFWIAKNLKLFRYSKIKERFFWLHAYSFQMIYKPSQADYNILVKFYCRWSACENWFLESWLAYRKDRNSRFLMFFYWYHKGKQRSVLCRDRRYIVRPEKSWR